MLIAYCDSHLHLFMSTRSFQRVNIEKWAIQIENQNQLITIIHCHYIEYGWHQSLMLSFSYSVCVCCLYEMRSHTSTQQQYSVVFLFLKLFSMRNVSFTCVKRLTWQNDENIKWLAPCCDTTHHIEVSQIRLFVHLLNPVPLIYCIEMCFVSTKSWPFSYDDTFDNTIDAFHDIMNRNNTIS